MRANWIADVSLPLQSMGGGFWMTTLLIPENVVVRFAETISRRLVQFWIPAIPLVEQPKGITLEEESATPLIKTVGGSFPINKMLLPETVKL